MKLVFGHDPTVNEWIKRRYGAVVAQSPAVTIGTIDSKGILRGAYVTTWKSEATAELHLYGVTSNDTWKGYFSWMFEHAYRIEVLTDKRNKKIRKAAPKFGFKFEGVSRDYYGPGRDALRFYMTPHHCRWIKADGLAVQVS